MWLFKSYRYRASSTRLSNPAFQHLTLEQIDPWFKDIDATEVIRYYLAKHPGETGPGIATAVRILMDEQIWPDSVQDLARSYLTTRGGVVKCMNAVLRRS